MLYSYMFTVVNPPYDPTISLLAAAVRVWVSERVILCVLTRVSASLYSEKVIAIPLFCNLFAPVATGKPPPVAHRIAEPALLSGVLY